MGLIKSWSYSSLKSYEACPYRIKLKADKAPTIERPTNRGLIIHKAAEDFVTGRRPDLVRELRKHFNDEFHREREMYQNGQLKVEEPWAFDKFWMPVDWSASNAWLRMMLDQFHYTEGQDIATVLDIKTGKKWGNEVSHTQQGQLYSIGVMMLYPDIQSVDVRFRYVDEKKETSKVYFRDDKFDRLFEKFNERAEKMLSDKTLRPKPSRSNCRFCDYSPNPEVGSGACTYGIPFNE